jgi:hypothetical protein
MNNALYALYKVELDFDEAKKANKKYVGNGTYKYFCIQKLRLETNVREKLFKVSILQNA